jgi:hypothetical protein
LVKAADTILGDVGAGGNRQAAMIRGSCRSLLYDLVGQECFGDGEARGLGSLHIDDQLDLRGLLDR